MAATASHHQNQQHRLLSRWKIAPNATGLQYHARCSCGRFFTQYQEKRSGRQPRIRTLSSDLGDRQSREVVKRHKFAT
jgi:hypothetical protein